MTTDDSASMPSVLARLESNDPDAQALVVARFTPRLIALARKRLHPRVRGKVDPEDVVQSVYRSFFLRYKNSGFDLKHWESLWALLTTITWRKCRRQAERFLSDQRNVNREAPAGHVEDSAAANAVNREPTAEEAAMVAEAVEEVMHRLKTERKQKIFQLSLQGFTAAEISENLGHYERGVRRVREEIRSILEELALRTE